MQTTAFPPNSRFKLTSPVLIFLYLPLNLAWRDKVKKKKQQHFQEGSQQQKQHNYTWEAFKEPYLLVWIYSWDLLFIQ